MTLSSKRDDQILDYVEDFAHDINNMLAGVDGFLQLVRGYGPLNDQQQGYLDRAGGSLARIHNLVNMLRTLAEVDRGEVVLSLDDVDLRRSVEDTLNLLEPEIRKNNLSIEFPAEDGRCIALADPGYIGQVIFNLVQNAVKYNKIGGVISIRLRRQDKAIRFEVHDTGIGIPKDELKEVFNRRVRASNHGDVKGTGLGLAIVKTLVDLHGGKIWVESIEKQGSTFFMLVAAADESDETMNGSAHLDDYTGDTLGESSDAVDDDSQESYDISHNDSTHDAP